MDDDREWHLTQAAETVCALSTSSARSQTYFVKAYHCPPLARPPQGGHYMPSTPSSFAECAGVSVTPLQALASDGE